MLSQQDRQAAVSQFIELVRFKTVSGDGPLNGEYNACGNWLLQKQLDIGLEAEIIPESKPNKPIVVGKWAGSMPDLPAVLLNSHYDVVPVVEAEWSVPAFEGFERDGRIYGRGTQDM
jgi:acetylornithine deacetylase/succinyl-diaminopimelate desuccinylase-like protein